jgi:hypothetical protein
LRLRMKEVITRNTRIKPKSAANPKTEPERGLFSRKEFPLAPEVTPGGGAVAELVCVIVVAPSGWLVGTGGVSVGEAGGTDKL